MGTKKVNLPERYPEHRATIEAALTKSVRELSSALNLSNNTLSLFDGYTIASHLIKREVANSNEVTFFNNINGRTMFLHERFDIPMDVARELVTRDRSGYEVFYHSDPKEWPIDRKLKYLLARIEIKKVEVITNLKKRQPY